jgi:hypothetical protein
MICPEARRLSRDVARELAKTEAFERSRRDRKDGVGWDRNGLPLASPTMARDASLHAGVQARLAQQSSDCDRSRIC